MGTELDEAWGRINAMGGTIVDDRDDYGRGRNHAINQALAIIEELGGKDPATARKRFDEMVAKFRPLYEPHSG